MPRTHYSERTMDLYNRHNNRMFKAAMGILAAIVIGIIFKPSFHDILPIAGILLGFAWTTVWMIIALIHYPEFVRSARQDRRARTERRTGEG